MFKIKTWQAGASRAVHKSQTGDFGRARTRKGMNQTSRLAVREYNRRLARWLLTLILNTNFLPGDGHMRLHHWKYAKPTPEAAMHMWDVFTKQVRRACKRAGVPFKYVHALGLGERGAMHHHLVVNKEAEPIAAKLWRKYGHTHTDHLYEWQNYQGLAWYFCGQDKGENPEDKKEWTIWKGYSCSRNLERPAEDTRMAAEEKWEKYPEPTEGYIIDVKSLDIGESPVTGREYLRYIELPLDVGGRKGLEREQFVAGEQARNKAMVEVTVDALYVALEERRRLWAVRDEDAA